MTALDAETAAKFARLALGHVSREYPNKLDHVLAGPEDAATPRALHPIFFGSFDWHSCVHAFWLMARLVRRFPALEARADIEALVAARFTPASVEAECAYLARPQARGFERPYGWVWALALQAELSNHQGGALGAAKNALRPLAQAFAERFEQYLPLCDYPVRAGVHTNTAFALRLAADYAETADAPLMAHLRAAALNWYGADADCQAWEPSQDDFLSPALIEAECMRRLLDAGRFRTWFAAFLPSAGHGEPRALFEPARVSDRSDGKIAHLDGFNFSRAWCWRAIAAALDPADRARERALAAAERYLEASLPHVAGDYAGEHWLATFATLALDGL